MGTRSRDRFQDILYDSEPEMPYERDDHVSPFRLVCDTCWIFIVDRMRHPLQFFVMLLGLGLLITSTVYLVHVDDSERVAKVTTYNGYVEAWQSYEREIFKNVTFDVRLRIIDEDTAISSLSDWENLQPITTDDVMEDSSPNELHDYDALRYQAGPQAAMLSATGWDEAEAALDFKAVTMNSAGETVESEFSYGPFSVTRRDIFGGIGWKSCFHGKGGTIIHNDGCVVYVRASQVCVSVANDTQGHYYIDYDTHTNGGCDMAGGWDPVHYSRIRSRSKEGYVPSASAMDIDDFEVVIRSAADPYIEAEFLTDAYLDFGLTKSQQVVLWVMALVVSLLLLFPGMIVLGEATLWSWRRYQSFRYRGCCSDDFDDLDGIDDPAHDAGENAKSTSGGFELRAAKRATRVFVSDADVAESSTPGGSTRDIEMV
eukprot:Rmarinus@m.18969